MPPPWALPDPVDSPIYLPPSLLNPPIYPSIPPPRLPRFHHPRNVHGGSGVVRVSEQLASLLPPLAVCPAWAVVKGIWAAAPLPSFLTHPQPCGCRDGLKHHSWRVPGPAAVVSTALSPCQEAGSFGGTETHHFCVAR